MKKEYIYRGAYYVIGLLLLAFGLVLNTKACLGVTPIMSFAYCVSNITGINLGNVTLVWYSFFIIIEIILHTKKENNKVTILMDLLQLPLSLIFTRFINLFTDLIPSCSDENIFTKLFVLFLAIVLTGLGAALSLNTKLIPNPGDGVVKAIADTIGKNIGITKNCVDAVCVLLALCTGLIFEHAIIGIGIGTICAIFGVGRVIALFNRYLWCKIQQSTGIEPVCVQ